MSVSVDYLVKDRDCAVSIKPQLDTDLDELIAFRLEANVNTYWPYTSEINNDNLLKVLQVSENK